MKSLPKVRKFHSAVWSEPIIMEMGRKGERGILVPGAEQEIKAKVGKANSYIPEKMRRKDAVPATVFMVVSILLFYFVFSGSLSNIITFDSMPSGLFVTGFMALIALVYGFAVMYILRLLGLRPEKKE